MTSTTPMTAGRWQTSSFGRPLVILLVAGAIVRALLVAWFHTAPIRISDALEYNTIAVNLAERGVFASAGGEPTSIRPPLYPGLVALVYRIAGTDNHLAVYGMQAVLGLLTAWIVHQLALAMYGRRVAIWAAAAVCFYPSLLFLSNQLLTEVLFTFFLCCVCFSMQRYLATGAVGWLVGLGVVLGLATLTRSVLWLFPPFLIVFLLWATSSFATRPESARSESARSWWRCMVLAGVPVLASLVVIAPWVVRNSRLQATFTTIDVMGGRNFMMGNYEFTPMFRAWDAISMSGEQAWYNILTEEHPEFPQLTQGQKDKLAMKRGLRYVMEHPGQTAQRDLVKFINFWQLERTVAAGFARGYWGSWPPGVAAATAGLIAGVYAIVMLLGIFGFIMTRPTDLRLHGFLLLLVAFFCAAHTAVFAHERYRLPLMPLVILYAAAAVVRGEEIWRRRGEFGFWLASVLGILLAASWVWEVMFVEWPAIRDRLM